MGRLLFDIFYFDLEINDYMYLEFTALIWAVRGGYENIVTLLIEYGADINHWNVYEETSLDHAILCGYDSIEDLL